MKELIYTIVLLIPLLSFSQTGPGGIGNNSGTSNLDFWFNANTGAFNDAGITLATNGQTVRQWNDQSGNDNNANQGTTNSRPTFVTNSMNGYPTIDLDGITTGDGDWLSFPFTSTQNASIFFVAEGTYSNSIDRYILSINAGITNTYCLKTSSTNFQTRFNIGINNSGILNTTVNNATPFILQYDLVKQGSSELLSLGTSSGSAVTNNSPSNNGVLGTTYIGVHPDISNHWDGGIAEIIYFNSVVNEAQSIIINNYLAAKYDFALTANDIYDEDNIGNGNYDHDVAGIGRVDASNIHDDAQGTGIVRIHNPSGLGDNEFLMWGHDNGALKANEKTDIPAGVEARFNRVWRVSEKNPTDASNVNVGAIDMAWDLTGLGTVTASDLRLLIDTDNDGTFADETPILGATSTGSNIYQFTSVPGTTSAGISNNRRFTLGTINSTQTPLPIELINFNATEVEGELQVLLNWQTTSEINNDYFTIERSFNGLNWEIVKEIDGAVNSSTLLSYDSFDEKPYLGTSYYRLKQTDFDGQFEYSQVESVTIDKLTDTQIQIYPNPTKNRITIIGNADELSQVKIYNTLGQDVTKYTNFITNNKSSLTIDLSNLSKEMYYLKTKTTINKVYKQ